MSGYWLSVFRRVMGLALASAPFWAAAGCGARTELSERGADAGPDDEPCEPGEPAVCGSDVGACSQGTKVCLDDETFGPCIPVMAYADTEEAIRLANDTQFGLTASVIAGDVEEAKAIGKRINAGGIFLQDTFLTFAKLRTFGSDSFGWSGYGAPRIGPESLRRFLRRKSILSQHGPVADIQDDHHLGKQG